MGRRGGAAGGLLLLALVGGVVIWAIGSGAPTNHAAGPAPAPLTTGSRPTTTERVPATGSQAPAGQPAATSPSVTSSVASTPASTVPTPAELGPSSFVETWTAGPFPRDKGAPIAESSPMVATLDGKGPAVVVGDRRGLLYAYHLSDGTPVAGWPAYDGGAPIDSTPSIAPGGNGRTDLVYVGAGNAAVPDQGGYEAFAPSGRRLWSTPSVDPPTDNHPAMGVQASLAIASVQGRAVVFAGSLGQESYALSSGNGKALPGWPWFSADTVFSTAAVADLYGDGQTELVVGGASTPGVAYGHTYGKGGHLRILNSTGGLVCHYDTNQEIDSSPAVGAFLAGGATGIVVGTGSYYDGASDTAKLMGFNDDCGLVWSDALDGVTSSSPALADIDGNGKVWAVEGTDDGRSGGSVWVIDPATGAVRWKKGVLGRVIGSVVTADLSGLGYQDLLVPTIKGVEILDGRSGAVVAVLPGSFQNSPLVTDDPNGTIGITVAGYNGANEGVIYHYEIPGSNGTAAVGGGAWPMFHHDAQLSGTQPSPTRPTPCPVPSPAAAGYDLVASDGGVFSFGQPFCGSVRDPNRVAPIVAAATAPGSRGYWLASADGGVYSFGTAGFYGSASGKRLARPVVGMAATPDGKGYWLVTSDGGVFTYGDAHFYGSAAGTKTKSPVVGMAATSDGRGYRLVTANGEVYCFGDAGYFGGASRDHLAHPVVGIATDGATGGYWLVDAGGGVFSFKASFYGSAGGGRLARPVSGIQSTANGRGYWLVASDGGVYAFGDAPFRGSTSRSRLAASVVSLISLSG